MAAFLSAFDKLKKHLLCAYSQRCISLERNRDQYLTLAVKL